MPGKQETEYFPLNLSTMNRGMGFYGEVSPILIPHRGKFDATVVHHGSPIAMALHNSPVNATLLSENLMSEYINVNGLPPVNSEDEEEDDDDIVSQSGSESVVSVQGSDIDLDMEAMDDMDSLVLNIRDKLRMAAPQYSLHHHHNLHSSASDYWTDSPSATSTPNSIHSTSTDNELLILSPGSNSTGTSGIGGSSNNTTSTNSNSMGSKSSSSSSSKNQRKRRGTLSRSSNLQQWRHSHPNATNSYYKQFNTKHGGSISKSNKKNYQSSHWWSSRTYGDLSKQSRPKDAYELLQELIHSGTLIQEAVRRLNRKCLSTSSSNNNNGSTISSNSSSNQDPITPSNSTASLLVSSTKFSYLDEESSDASTYSSHHHSSLHISAPCN